MTTQTVSIANKLGFHARPASLLIECAKKFQSHITLAKGERTSDLKSIVTLLKMQGKMGDQITITAEGADEAQAVSAIAQLIESKFGEE